MSCILCGSTDYEVIWDKIEREKKGILRSVVIRDNLGNILNGTNVICRGCGLIYVVNRMDRQELIDFYENDYRNIYGKATSFNASIHLHARHALECMKDVGVKRGAKVLDIGCAVGTFLEGCKEYDAFGIEPNKKTYEIARENNLDVANTTIEEFNPASKYDLISLQNTLEHLYDPISVIQKARNILTDDGLLLISVPNVLTCVHWLAVDAFMSCAHLFAFSQLTLVQLMLKCGFREHATYTYFESMGEKLYCFFKKCEPQTPQFIKPDVEKYKRFLSAWDDTAMANYDIKYRFDGLKSPLINL